MKEAATSLIVGAWAFIRGERDADLWPPHPGAAPNAMTSAEVMEALAASNLPALPATASGLLDLQRDDGSWTDPNAVGEPWDCSATAWASWALRRVPEAHAAAARGARFLARNVTPTGGLATNHSTRGSNTYASAYGLRVLASFGHAREARSVANFLHASQNSDGGWGLNPGDPSEQTLTMYVLDGVADTPSFVSEISTRRALDWLGEQRNDDGTFGSWLEDGVSMEGTAYGLHVLRKFGRIDPRRDRGAVNVLLEGRRSERPFEIDGHPRIWVAASVMLAGAAIAGAPQ